MAAYAVDDRAVNAFVRHAVEGIDVNKQGQTLHIQGGRVELFRSTLTHHDMQYVVNLLQHHPLAVDNLVMEFLILTRQAVDVLGGHFTRYTMTRKMPLRYISFKTVNLGNDNGGRLLSRLGGNNSVKKFDFNNVGLEGRRGGEILSDLLQHNPQTIQVLSCYDLPLGVEGARALQPGIRANRTANTFELSFCRLGDEGVSLIVDAIHDRNITMARIKLTTNGFTRNCLPHVTRLLPLIRHITIASNYGIFNDQEKSGLFFTALQNAQEICVVNLSFCDMPRPVVTALFQALSNKTKPIILHAYDINRLEGVDLQRVLEIIPLMKNLQKLAINLDYMDAAVLNSFRQNTSIQSLVTYNPTNTTTIGPISMILKRNRRVSSVTTLLDSERERELPLGLWSNALGRLTRDDDDNTSTVATTVYKIMQEKLAMWCAPDQTTTPMTNYVASSTSSTTPTIATASHSSSSTTETDTAPPTETNGTTNNNNNAVVPKKRSYAQANNNNTAVGDDDNDDEAVPGKTTGL